MRETALMLRRKYELAHVPSMEKVEKWVRETEKLMEDGYPSEHAGMEAAGSVFTYEYHEHRVFNETPVEQILAENRRETNQHP